MGKVKENYYVPKKTNRDQHLRESFFRKKILVLREHSYASRNAGGESSRARCSSVCSKRTQDQENTNTLLSNMISPVSQDQENNCVIIESLCYENEHETPIMDEIISTGISDPLDINLVEENNQSTSGANPLQSEQDPAMSILPDEQLHEFSFISQEEYNEVNEHIIEVERTRRPDSTVIQGNRIVDLEYVT
ncbi:unnamed protein product [Ceutorhynchus assimilis]|uniref:Uncharacterized protein n=1 Tax=Ceutorhynchus assimilis TaxID=467358 RepID=A0A9N9MF94_9CUCU|nr:unnamed protein product [Ceutorhynchus assimilis]